MKTLIKLLALALASIVYWTFYKGYYGVSTKTCSVMNAMVRRSDLNDFLPLNIVWNKFGSR